MDPIIERGAFRLSLLRVRALDLQNQNGSGRQTHWKVGAVLADKGPRWRSRGRAGGPPRCPQLGPLSTAARKARNAWCCPWPVGRSDASLDSPAPFCAQPQRSRVRQTRTGLPRPQSAYVASVTVTGQAWAIQSPDTQRTGIAHVRATNDKGPPAFRPRPLESCQSNASKVSAKACFRAEGFSGSGPALSGRIVGVILR